MVDAAFQQLLLQLHDTSARYPSPYENCIPVRLSTLIDIQRLGRLGEVQAVLRIDFNKDTVPCGSNYLMVNDIGRDLVTGVYYIRRRPIKIYGGFVKSTTKLRDHLTMQDVHNDQWLLFYKEGETPPSGCCFWNLWCSHVNQKA